MRRSERDFPRHAASRGQLAEAEPARRRRLGMRVCAQLGSGR
jgi:hypothetical protein